LFSFNNPLGACPTCQGFGSVPSLSFERVVPDPSKSLREGAIAPWTTPKYRHELDELLALAGDYGIPTDIPFSELTPEHLALIREGVPERRFGGLRGFFRWLERHRYELPVRVFLSRWRSYETCPACRGDRLQPLALAVRVGSQTSEVRGQRPGESRLLSIAELCRLEIPAAVSFLESVAATISPAERTMTKAIFDELRTRLRYLAEVGLDYLTLDRQARTLSGGEAQRVALTGTLGSTLVNTLYVLDEPSAGLHPRDSERVIAAIKRLRDARNTVVVVEHEDAFIRQAEQVIDVGPGAGREGGEIIFQGPPAGLLEGEGSVTGAYLSGRRFIPIPQPEQRRAPNAWLTLTGARHHNLKNLTVEFPLGVLCVVTGVSGSGKSTLIDETLYPALCRALKQPCATESPGAFDALAGVEQIDEVVLADQSPIGRTPRSNPVTYLKAFDEIRKIFADTPDAKLRNLTATAFSFNAAAGGRCPKCQGSGVVEVEMQFLADISMTCPECHGTRYRPEVLEVKYRNLTIADVLALTVREAFSFFRTHRKLQRQLKFLKDVGLDYLPLGQPATTLSGGESQRLKLASFLASGTRSRTLFLIDEPTLGLHTADVAQLLTCFESLLAVGHSLIVVEHDLDVIRSADWVIDLGPEAGDAGGRIVASGTPERIAQTDESITGEHLRRTTR
jgi:excinuclease ABC subunit A